MHIEKKIKQIIIDVLGLEKTPDELPSDVPLLEMGLQLDSLMGLRIVLELEKRFEFAIQLGDLNREVFSSVNQMTRFVEDKLHAKGN
jgi:acyl carrier protein